jgi:hypothetical protein
MFKKDSYIPGLILGIISPAILYAILYGVDLLFVSYFGKHIVRAPHYLILLSVIPNLFWLRYYMSKKKFTKTGMALLLTTIIFVLLYLFKYFETTS